MNAKTKESKELLARCETLERDIRMHKRWKKKNVPQMERDLEKLEAEYEKAIKNEA